MLLIIIILVKNYFLSNIFFSRYDQGNASKYIHDDLKVGDTLAIKGPIVKWDYKSKYCI
jgi:ferredoxin-NADP reductase